MEPDCMRSYLEQLLEYRYPGEYSSHTVGKRQDPAKKKRKESSTSRKKNRK